MSWFEQYPLWSLAWGVLGLALLVWGWQLRSRSVRAFERLMAWMLPAGWLHLALSIPLFNPNATVPAEMGIYYTCAAILLTLEMLPLFLGTFTAIAVAKKYHQDDFESLFLGARAHLETGLLPLWILVQAGFAGIYLLV